MFEFDEKNPGVAPEVATPETAATAPDTEGGTAPAETPTVEFTEQKPAAGESATTAAAGQKGKQQAPETNAAFAKLRREAEEAKAQVRQYQADIEAKESAKAAEARKQRAEELRGLGVDPDIIDDLIKSHPEVQSLARENAQLKRKSQDEALVQQFTDLTEAFPAIKEPGDIDQDTWRKFQGSAGHLTLLDAYVSAHSKDILSAARGAGEQDAVAKLAGKQHLQTEKSVGKTGEEIDVHIDEEHLRVWNTMGFDEKAARAAERKRIKERGGK